MKKKSINIKKKENKYTFPEYGIVVNATDIKEAIKKANKIISKK